MAKKEEQFKYLYSVIEDSKTKQKYILSLQEIENSYLLYKLDNKQKTLESSFLGNQDFKLIKHIPKYGQNPHFSRILCAIFESKLRKNKGVYNGRKIKKQ